MDSYDSLPYDSLPIPETRPEQIAALAALFGIAAAAPDRCRLLELGCASGANLIPLAFYRPDSQFVGLERSAVQAQAARTLIERLELRNITLIEGDILDFQWAGDPFDYVVCHGVFSWAPAPVQARILEIASRHLAPGGLAYVSYNTLPGWRLRGMLRDALRHAANGATTPAEQLVRARRQLEAMTQALAGIDAHAARHLAAEAARLRTLPDSYLFHEYLEDINEPMLFADFAALAGRHGLDYLTEAVPDWLIPDALPDSAAAWLRGIRDPLEREQQLDFVITRAFRRSLLVRAGTARAAMPDFARLAGMAFCSSARPRKELRLARPQRVEFVLPDGRSGEVEHPLTKASLAHLAAVYPDSVSFEELAALAHRAVHAAGGQRHAGQDEHLFAELASLFLRRIVLAEPAAQTWPRGSHEPPRANRLARVLVESGAAHVATPRHLAYPIGEAERRSIALMDGRLRIEDIAGATGSPRAATEKIIAALSYQGLTI